MSLEGPNAGLKKVEFQIRSTGAKDLERNTLRNGVHQRGYLPHVKQEHAAYFVTFRLADSLPKEILLRIESERAEQLQRLKQTNHDSHAAIQEADLQRHRAIERYLDSGAGKCELQRPEIAKIVADALVHFHNDRYILKDWVIMPNHVHAVLHPLANHTLSQILRTWKQFTATQANRFLHRQGERFWQPESYDHWIRNPDEHTSIARYIRHNPVKANLCHTPEAWPWSSAARTVAQASEPAVSPTSSRQPSGNPKNRPQETRDTPR